MHTPIAEAIRAAASGPAPSEPSTIAGWLGAGSDAQIATLALFKSDADRESYVQAFAEAVIGARRLMLHELAHAIEHGSDVATPPRASDRFATANLPHKIGKAFFGMAITGETYTGSVAVVGANLAAAARGANRLFNFDIDLARAQEVAITSKAHLEALIALDVEGLASAARALVAMTHAEAAEKTHHGMRFMFCQCDVRNPCWEPSYSATGWGEHGTGKHWGGGDACQECNLRAAVFQALGGKA